MAPRVLVVEDSWAYADALSRALELRGIHVVAIAETAREAMREAQRLHPDVALVDLSLPDGDGIELCPRLQEASPGVAVVIVTSTEDERVARRALAAGACGYIVKHDSTDPDRCADAVRSAARGDLLLDRDVQRLVRGLAAAAPDPATEAGLTPREREILPMLANGLTNKEIAAELMIGEQAVKNHVGNILRKLGAGNRTQASMRARQRGIIC